MQRSDLAATVTLTIAVVLVVGSAWTMEVAARAVATRSERHSASLREWYFSGTLFCSGVVDTIYGNCWRPGGHHRLHVCSTPLYPLSRLIWLSLRTENCCYGRPRTLPQPDRACGSVIRPGTRLGRAGQAADRQRKIGR